MVHSNFFFAYLVVIGNIGSRFSMKSHSFLIFDRLDQINSETRPIHPIFTNLLIGVISGIGIGAVTLM